MPEISVYVESEQPKNPQEQKLLPGVLSIVECQRSPGPDIAGNGSDGVSCEDETRSTGRQARQTDMWGAILAHGA